MPNDGVFDDTTREPNVEVTVEDLVGEGRKYATVEDLAKAYANADRFINQLKTEKTELNVKVQTYEDLIKNRPNPNQTPEQRQSDPPEAPSPELDAEKFKDIARKTFEEISQTERVKRNQERAADRMVEVYGSTEKANQAVRQKAAELGVSVEWLLDTAGRSPHAFEATMGLNTREAPKSTYAPTDEFVPRKPMGRSEQKTMAYYDNIRKTDPNRYWSRQIQDEIMKEAMTQGDAFFS